MANTQDAAKAKRDGAIYRAYRRVNPATSKAERFVVEVVKPGSSYKVSNARLGSEVILAPTCDAALTQFLEV